MHPNIAALSKFDPADLEGSADALAPDVVWHYYNPQLPELHGDYVGVVGVMTFFSRLAEMTDGTFKVNVNDAWPVGGELVVVHTTNTLTLGQQNISVEVVVVWRIIDGRIAEVWDIPSLSDAVVATG